MFTTASAQRFLNAIQGKSVDRTPVVPKIWLDWTAAHGYVDPASALTDPEISMLGIIRAAMDMEFDAARVFLMPRRPVVEENGTLIHISDDGHRLGAVDLSGGWATRLTDSTDFNLTDPNVMMNPQSYAARVAPVQTMDDICRIAIPTADWYEAHGYGAMLDRAIGEADGKIALIGDCNTGTLSFYIAMRGMMNAMMDLIEDPELVHACMEKGIAISLERAKFFLNHGIRVLRYNDSSANMKLISADMWREYIAPHLKYFCSEVHRMAPDAKLYCHICGDVRPILKDLVDVGLDCIAPLDPLGGCSVKDIRDLVETEIVLMGGVNTLTLLKGTPESVEQEASACIRSGGRGFIVGSGCAVARDTPPENLRALVQASVTCGECSFGDILYTE